QRHLRRYGPVAVDDGKEKIRILVIAKDEYIGHDADDDQVARRGVASNNDPPREPEVDQDRCDRKDDERWVPPGVERERREGRADDGRLDAVACQKEMKCDRTRKKEENEFRRIEQHQEGER